MQRFTRHLLGPLQLPHRILYSLPHPASFHFRLEREVRPLAVLREVMPHHRGGCLVVRLTGGFLSRRTFRALHHVCDSLNQGIAGEM